MNLRKVQNSSFASDRLSKMSFRWRRGVIFIKKLSNFKKSRISLSLRQFLVLFRNFRNLVIIFIRKRHFSDFGELSTRFRRPARLRAPSSLAHTNVALTWEKKTWEKKKKGEFWKIGKMEPLKEANVSKSRLPVKRGIPTPAGKHFLMVLFISFANFHFFSFFFC